MVPGTEALGIAFLRKLSLAVSKADVSRVKGVVPPTVADYLLNRKRRDIVELEKRRDIVIDIEGDASLLPFESRIETAP